jgi:ATP-binding cassette subfamily B protein AbcA/BmrA
MSKISKYFHPTKSNSEVPELSVKKHLFRTLYKGVKIPWISLTLGAIFAVFNSLVILTQYQNYMAIFTGKMTDLTPLWMYLGASFLQYIVIFAGVLADLGFVTVVTGVRKKMWKKMLNLSLRDFDTAEPNGMLSRITSDAEYASKPFYAIIALLQIIVYIISVSAVAPKEIPQALIILAITLVLAGVTIFFSVKVCSKATTLVQNSISLQTNHYTEQLGSYKFIKASSAEDKAIAKSLELIDNRYNASLYNAFATGLQTLANSFPDLIIYCCAFLGGIWAISLGEIKDMTPINAIYVFGMALELTLIAVMTLPSYFAATFGGSKELVSVFQRPEEDILKGKELTQGQGALALEGVSFSYAQKAVVDNVSLQLPEGQVTAIIGTNGSGKSTLLKLIDRLYPASQGEITLNGEKGSGISLKSWREQFGLVSQNASLFSGSIRSNISYGLSRQVTEEEFQHVVSLARLDEVVASHPGGLEYDVGIKGCHLSGGEQERVAIARALLKDPKYLILDEATANLDAKTADEIDEGLSALMKGRTVILVAHHYAPVKKAAYVVVMDHGKVVDSGAPAELLKRNAYYKSLSQSD